jgi:hypothetical protein
MRKVDLYIETVENSGNYSKIELFNDEEITVSSSIQNINDISKIFTDYSQSFTVPSSVVNNAIFEHFYNNDVDTLLDHNLRRNAFIEIDYIPFRTGKIQLEKAMVKNNQNENYSITFYGEVLSLKDKFGETKLKDLDVTFVDAPYSGTDVQTAITDTTDVDVRYPLITSQRLWTYGDATSTDISTTGGKINYTELFPALKISKIFEAIELRWSIDFQGLFLTDTRFTNCFLYLKNKEAFEVFTETQKVNVVTSDNHLDSIAGFQIINPTTDVVNFRYWNQYSYFLYGNQSLELIVSGCSNLSATYYIDIYENNTLINTLTGTGNATYSIINYATVVGLNKEVYCTLRANQTVSLTLNYNYIVEETYDFGLASGGTTNVITESDIVYGIGTSQTLTTTYIDLSSFMPDMTVYDFISGIFKNFNLTCYAKSKTIFQIEPLEDWYNKGRIIDITQYTTTEEISVSRIPLYKTIKFEHEQSQSFMNREFFDTFGKEYGDLFNTYNYDGADYQIKVPFENLLHSEFDGTMTQVGFCLTKKPDFKPYIPKPILLYMYEQQATSIKFYDGTTTNTLTTYMPFGQDMKQYSTNYSLNWGSDNSSLLNVPITQGKFATYYYGYLANLFNKKNRVTNVKTILPLSILTTLKLNDRLIIRDKRYIINQMNSKLTNGEVNLELVNDFRPIQANPIIVTGKPTSVIDTQILFPNFVKSATITTTTGGVTISPSTITSEQRISITVPTDTNVYYTRITEDGNTRVTETFSNRITEGGDNNVIPIDIEYTFEDGTIDTYYSYIIQKQ